MSEIQVTSNGGQSEPRTTTLEEWLSFDETCALHSLDDFFYPTAWGPTPRHGRVYRMPRVFVGAATLGSSDAPQSVLDILSEDVGSTTVLASFASYSPIGGLGVVGASRTGDTRETFGIDSGGSHGVSGIGTNNDLIGNGIAVGVFAMALHKAGAHGATEAAEITACNAGAVVTMTPNGEFGQGGHTVCANLTAGKDGYTNNISMFEHYGSSVGGARATKGRVVAKDALDPVYGSGGAGMVDQFFAGQSIQWVDALDLPCSETWGDGTGLHVKSDVRVSGHLTPEVTNSSHLGTSTHKWNTLNLGTGGSVRFNGGDVTIIHTIDALSFNGAANGYTFDAPVRQTPGPSVTPATNGQMVFEVTNNTTLTVKVKGTDGVVRSTALTLA